MDATEQCAVLNRLRDVPAVTTVVELLADVNDPKTFYNDLSCTVSRVYGAHSLCQLFREFPSLSVEYLQKIWQKHNSLFLLSANALRLKLAVHRLGGEFDRERYDLWQNILPRLGEMLLSQERLSLASRSTDTGRFRWQSTTT